MARSYKSIRCKKHQVYTVQQVMDLYGVCRNTVSNWVRSGLAPSPCEGTQIFRGSELSKFHEMQAARRKHELRFGEFFCLKCRAAVRPDHDQIDLSGRDRSAWSKCPNCQGVLSKILHATECDALKKAHIHSTPPDYGDEVIVPVPARIVKILDSYADKTPTANDRILLEWQDYAGRWDEKTVDAHLTAIREFEVSMNCRPFVELKKSDVSTYRDSLLKRVEDGAISRSTASHRASSIRAFIDWLAKQEGYRRLSKSLPDYCELPKKMKQAGAIRKIKEYPSLEEAERMLVAMPETCLLDRRHRAIFATACLTGLRAGAIATIRRMHIDLSARQVIQDGNVMRAKNGKSYVANFFPRCEVFEKELIGWVNCLEKQGLKENDAVFPSMADLSSDRLARPNRDAIEPMSAESAVTAAFAAASKSAVRDYTPHSARHMLKALGDELCNSEERRKAWSQNLGHEEISITNRHYGKVSDERRAEIFGGFHEKGVYSEEESELMLQYHEHRLFPNSPEFRKAEKLVLKRKRIDLYVFDGDEV